MMPLGLTYVKRQNEGMHGVYGCFFLALWRVRWLWPLPPMAGPEPA